MRLMREQRPKVAVFVDAVYYTSRRFLEGFLEYTRIYEPWTVTLKTGRGDERASLRSGEYAGIVAENPTGLVRDYAKRHNVPVITILQGRKLPQSRPFPQAIANVNCDDVAVAKMAGEYLVEKGFRSFAYVGSGVDLPFGRRRGRVFAKTVSKSGPVRRYAGGDLADFLRSLPSGTGLFVAHDPRAQEVLEVAKAAGVAVPDDVAVISVDDEELLCETTSPTLTSIAWNCRTSGYEAARRLHAAIRHPARRQPYREIYDRPVEVVARQSTNRQTCADEAIARCLELMALNLSEKVLTARLAKGVGISRRTLERRFREVTGESLGTRLLEMRITRAEELLKRTSLPLGAIAERCGFYDASHLSNAFRRLRSVTPTSIRTEL